MGFELVGRGGRDGAQCTATFYYNASEIGTNVKKLKEEVKKFCTLTTCRRKFSKYAITYMLRYL